MHYAIIAMGSRGDVQPFVALALGLLQRGHQVTLIAHGNFSSLAASYQIPFHPLSGNPEQWLQAPEGLRVLRSGSTIRFLRYLHDCYRAVQDKLI